MFHTREQYMGTLYMLHKNTSWYVGFKEFLFQQRRITENQ